MVALVLLGVFFLMLFARMVMPDLFRNPMPTDPALQNAFARMVTHCRSGDSVCSAFSRSTRRRADQGLRRVRGSAKEAFNVIIADHTVFGTMLVAISMFKGAGGIDLLTKF